MQAFSAALSTFSATLRHSVHAVRAAGEDEADGLHCEKVRKRRRVGLDLAVNAAFAHAACDELVVLAAKVQYDDGLMVHIEILLPYPIIW